MVKKASLTPADRETLEWLTGSEYLPMLQAIAAERATTRQELSRLFLVSVTTISARLAPLKKRGLVLSKKNRGQSAYDSYFSINRVTYSVTEAARRLLAHQTDANADNRSA